MAAFYSPQSNFTDVFQSTPLCYMWNIWAQNVAIKDMQFSSEIDRKEGGILNSGPCCNAGNIWCVWSGKW